MPQFLHFISLDLQFFIHLLFDYDDLKYLTMLQVAKGDESIEIKIHVVRNSEI